MALGDLLHGLPINSSQEYTGSFWDLLQPYALFTGVTLVLICLLHGATFLSLKTTGDMRDRPGAWPAGSPRHRRGRRGLRHLDARDVRQGHLFLNPVELLAVLAVIAAVWLVYEHRDGLRFAATTVTMASCILSIFVDLYPNVMVSSTNPAYNLTVHNTASGAVLAQGDDRRRRHLPAARARLPDLDLLRVPALTAGIPADAQLSTARRRPRPRRPASRSGKLPSRRAAAATIPCRRPPRVSRRPDEDRPTMDKRDAQAKELTWRQTKSTRW